MSVQSRQLLRLLKFVAELKKNSYPNASNFAKRLKEADINENIDCACSTRTIMRDIEILQREYNAPIEYDAQNRGFYLTNPAWDFEGLRLDENTLNNILLGTHLSTEILPEPLKKDVALAMGKGFVSLKNDFFDGVMIESLLCITGIKASVDAKIFKRVFDSWRRQQVIELIYKKPNSDTSKRKFEPHAIAFHRGIWYVKGYEFQTKNIKSYAIHRIESIGENIDIFERDKNLIADIKKHGLFEYPKLENVKLHCDKTIAFYLYEHQKTKKFKIEHLEDDSVIITLAPSFEHDIIRFILGEAGKIRVITPPSLRNKVAIAGKKIFDQNS